ncbi:hypothetical protein Tco_0029714, partial [Tanacetum coccineum]
MPRTSSDQLADNLHDVMMETLPSLVKEKVTEQVKMEVPAQVRDQVPVYLAEGLILERKTTKEETERLISKGQVTQDIMEEISLTIDESKLKKMTDEMLRQRCMETDIQEKEQKESQKQTNPSTGRKGPSQVKVK